MRSERHPLRLTPAISPAPDRSPSARRGSSSGRGQRRDRMGRRTHRSRRSSCYPASAIHLEHSAKFLAERCHLLQPAGRGPARERPSTPTGSGADHQPQPTRYTGPHEIRLVPTHWRRCLASVRGRFRHHTRPGGAITVTSRLYTGAQGSTAFGITASTSIRRSVPGWPTWRCSLRCNTRTNLTTDVSTRRSASLQAVSPNGFVTNTDGLSCPAGGQQQVIGIAPRVGMQPTDVGGLVVQPLTGELMRRCAIDNREHPTTSLPTFLDVVRIIPSWPYRRRQQLEVSQRSFRSTIRPPGHGLPQISPWTAPRYITPHATQ